MFPTRPAGHDKKAALLAKAKADRLARSELKKQNEENTRQEQAALRLQKLWQKRQARKATAAQLRVDWDALLAETPSTPALGLVRNLQLCYLLPVFYQPTLDPLDTERLSLLCKTLLSKTIEPTKAIGPGGKNTSNSSSPSLPAGSSASPSSESATRKPMPQVPFHMILLHVRYKDLGFKVLNRILRLCIKVVIGYNVPPPSTSPPSSSTSSLSQKASAFSASNKDINISISKAESARDLYVSGPELRFLLAYLDLNTYRLPGNVDVKIRTELQRQATRVLQQVIRNGQFYKDIHEGICLRTEAYIQLQLRSKKTELVPEDKARFNSISLWITAMWRCCLILQHLEGDEAKTATTAVPKRTLERDNLIDMHSDESTMVGIVCHVLTVPLFVDCLDETSLQLAQKDQLLLRSTTTLLDPRHTSFILSALSLDECLFFLGNMTKLAQLHHNASTTTTTNTTIPQQDSSTSSSSMELRVIHIASLLLQHCQQFVSESQTGIYRHYHPVFSWTSFSPKHQHQLPQAQFKLVLAQIEYLWSRDFALKVFSKLLKMDLPRTTSDAIEPLPTSTTNNNNNNNTGGSEKSKLSALSKLGPLKKHHTAAAACFEASDPQGALLAMDTQEICTVYLTMMKMFQGQRTSILVMLMYLPDLMVQLWRFMCVLGPKGRMHIYLEAAATATSGQDSLDREPLIAILQVFCECCDRLFVTLDDEDMYERQTPWQLGELAFMSGFFNQFCFAILCREQGSVPSNPATTTIATTVTPPNNSGTNADSSSSPPVRAAIFHHARKVLMHLYERDCRRAFCPPDHWLLLHPTKSFFQSPLQLLASLALSGRSNSSSSNGTGGGGLFSFGSSLSSLSSSTTTTTTTTSTTTTTTPTSTTSAASSSFVQPQYATPKEFIAKVAQRDRTALRILELLPHVIPFNARLEIFRNFIAEDNAQRMQQQHHHARRAEFQPAVMVKIRRGYVLEDGARGLGALSPTSWKQTIRVKFVNEVGAEEAGIDQGGPFKEFMETFLEAGFSPALDLFTTTTAAEHLMYPSPTALLTHSRQEGLGLLRLFGTVLGKALYEGLLVDVNFAGFFLSKILGRTVFLDEMRSYDEEVFRNLMFLKKYEGDVEDLGLTFSLDDEAFGQRQTIELRPNGEAVAVRRENRIHYIFLVSDYRLNKQIQEQSKAFIDGFRSIIPPSWVSIFSPQELHRVIAGEDVDFDVEDLKRHTEYQNGYFEHHPVIRNLWAVLNELPSEEKRAFLKFVTSCSKPPLGGFKHLYPPFTIRLVLNPNTTVSGRDGLAPRPATSDTSVTSHNSSGIQYDDEDEDELYAEGDELLESRERTTTSGGQPQQQPTATRSNRFGLGSRLRSVMGGSSGSGSNSNGHDSHPRSPSSASTSSSSGTSRRNNPFATTLDDQGTPAAMGVVKSFFGGLGSTLKTKSGLGSGGPSSSAVSGKKARLPTSSTCFNLLKLPPFSSKAVLRDKIRYAILSGTGFELS
ncbi:Ubiquitin-protein ligase E3B [Actinomortierella ambigua]|uniref:HECT-type E3 ubiquitin transferase n=1 Tax=Actinomortierella ambigua TaxID=1343610 RepID=A0A9P6Q3H0_9FUNG|nr:Ubiquitin-protein ligase E3B [Actinomortierella ambigua]